MSSSRRLRPRQGRRGRFQVRLGAQHLLLCRLQRRPRLVQARAGDGAARRQLLGPIIVLSGKIALCRPPASAASAALTAACLAVIRLCGLTVGEYDAGFDLLPAAGDSRELRIKFLNEQAAFPVVDPDQYVAFANGIARNDLNGGDPAGNPAAHGNDVGCNAGIRDEDVGELLPQPPATGPENDQRRQDRAIQSPWPGAARRGKRL